MSETQWLIFQIVSNVLLISFVILGITFGILAAIPAPPFKEVSVKWSVGMILGVAFPAFVRLVQITWMMHGDDIKGCCSDLKRDCC